MSEPVPIGALAVATSLRPRDVQELALAVGLPDEERMRLRDNGLVEIPVATRGLTDLVDEVLDGLCAAGWQPSTCQLAVFAHSLALDAGTCLALSTALGARLPGLADAPLFVTGRPCSVLHLGIEVAAHRQRRHPAGTTLVIGADLAPDDDERFFFGSAMGDAAVGLVLGGPAMVGHVLAVSSTAHIIADEGARSASEDIDRFRAQNPSAIRATIDIALADAGLTWAQLDAIVPHTPYRQIWDTIATLCRFPRERILDQDLSRTGHLNSNDVLVHLSASIQDGRLRPGDIAALVSPGFGGTRGCTLIRCGISP